MDLTVHLLTKNNEKTIKNTLESIQTLGCPILIADKGSTDSTLDICDTFDTQIYRVPQMTRENARNYLLGISKSNQQMYLEPWETLLSGHDQILRANPGNYNFTIINNQIISHEVRLWNKGKFRNPVFEFLDLESGVGLDVNIYSTGNDQLEDLAKEIEEWKIIEALNPTPYYYQACVLLLQKKYDDFLRVSEHYMFLCKDESKTTILNRFYYAYVQWMKNNAKPAVQNLLMCISYNPLMAEFWCLLGDVHYHLLDDYEKAREFYHNGLILGQFRVRYDGWPMEISKYKSHPERMISSCNQILNQQVYLK